MRFSKAISAAVVAPLIAAAPASYSNATSNTTSHAVGRLFSLNGKVTYFAGTNAWWLGHLTADSDVDITMSEIVSSNEKIVRVWGFGNSNTNTSDSVYFQLINETLPGTQTAINYGSNGISRLDSVVASAEKYGLQLVLPMLNNWDDLGGIDTYCNVFGCNATTFYTNDAAQAAYTNYVSFIVNRYKNSSAIFSWELCNEPRCNGCDSSVITNWASNVSSMIKTIDPSHMVTLGDEGWLCSGGDGSYAYSCAEGVDFEQNIQISSIDYGVLHLYPDSWGYNETWGNTWILEHDAIGKKYNKPVVVEEYGATTDPLASEMQWQATILNQTEIAADQFWQFGSLAPGAAGDGDEFTLPYNSTNFTILATDHAAAMLAKDVSLTYD